MFYDAKKISEISEVERMIAIISGRIMADAEYKSTYISFLSLGYSTPISSSFNDDLEEIITNLIDNNYEVDYYYKNDNDIDPRGLIITWSDDNGVGKT